MSAHGRQPQPSVLPTGNVAYLNPFDRSHRNRSIVISGVGGGGKTNVGARLPDLGWNVVLTLSVSDQDARLSSASALVVA